MPFGDKWRKQTSAYWDAMAERCANLPINDVLTSEILKCGSVIEIGCGAGHLCDLFRSAGFTGKYWGCDISPAAVVAARARLGDAIALEVGQFETLSDAGKVPCADVVVARSVVQHQAHWLPMVKAALRHAPLVLLGIIRSIYFKLAGEHAVHARGTFFDVCISLEAMAQEASAAGLACRFVHTEGRNGPEVVVYVSYGDCV